MDNIALSLYHTYIDLQKNVNRFEKEINKEKSDSVIHNGLNRKRIKIGLCGHYSAGKTTLLKRLFLGYAGAISSDPQTACLTIHRLDSFQGITIKFKEKFSVNPDEDYKFSKFLDDNKLENYVQQVSEIDWESCQKEEVSPDYRVLDTKRFLESVNHYMYAIEKIYWCHKKANNGTENALDFLEIYDLPGFGGQEAHEDIIKNIIQNESFDILICLIDSSQGLPTEKDIETLNNLSSTLERNNPELIFHWAYEQPIDDIDLETCLDGINKAISGKLTNRFFQKAILLDLTGDKEDTEIPQNVLLKQVLSVYFQKIGVDYLKSQSVFWDKEKETVPKLQLQPILNRIDDESRRGAVKRERAEKIFEEMLQLDFSIAKEVIFDIKKLQTLLTEKVLKKSDNDNHSLDGFEYPDEDTRELYITNLKALIHKTCQEIMDYICTPFTHKIDVNKLRPPYFPKKYKKKNDWIFLLENISYYRTLKNYESVGQFFLSGIGREIYRDIKQSLNQINRIVVDEKIIVAGKNPYSNVHGDFVNEKTEDNCNNAYFNSVVENDSALSIVAKEDLEIIRNDDKRLPLFNPGQEIIDLIKERAMEMREDVRELDETLDGIDNGYKEVEKETQKIDDFLSNLGI